MRYTRGPERHIYSDGALRGNLCGPERPCMFPSFFFRDLGQPRKHHAQCDAGMNTRTIGRKKSNTLTQPAERKPTERIHRGNVTRLSDTLDQLKRKHSKRSKLTTRCRREFQTATDHLPSSTSPVPVSQRWSALSQSQQAWSVHTLVTP